MVSAAARLAMSDMHEAAERRLDMYHTHGGVWLCVTCA